VPDSKEKEEEKRKKKEGRKERGAPADRCLIEKKGTYELTIKSIDLHIIPPVNSSR